MTFRTDLLPDLAAIRDIPGAVLDIRQHRVFLVTTLSSGATFGEGNQTEAETELFGGVSQPPRVKQASGEERALSGLGAGSLTVGPITPPRGVVGITGDELNGADLFEGIETMRFRVSGPLGNNYYTVADKEMHSPWRWMLTLEPQAAVPA